MEAIVMKLEEGKLVLTEEELKYVKQASMLANPLYAGTYLRNAVKAKNLEEDVDAHDVRYYSECIQAYRSNNYEVK
jgi:hypothetical protein